MVTHLSRFSGASERQRDFHRKSKQRRCRPGRSQGRMPHWGRSKTGGLRAGGFQKRSFWNASAAHRSVSEIFTENRSSEDAGRGEAKAACPVGAGRRPGGKSLLYRDFCYIYEIKEPGMPGLFIAFFIVCFI